MKETQAELHIQVLVDCPHCDNSIDLLDEGDTNGHNHNEEGAVLGQACPDGCWSEEHETFEIKYVTCSECKKEFHVKGMIW